MKGRWQDLDLRKREDKVDKQVGIIGEEAIWLEFMRTCRSILKSTDIQ